MYSQSRYIANSYYDPGRTSSMSTGANVSFLFAVNRLNPKSTRLRGDQWGNVFPPNVSEGFNDERPSVVMRYENGRVTEAQGYYWSREGGQGNAGRIVCYSGRPTTPYREQTVFSCNPHLPIIVGNFDPMAELHNDEDYADRKWKLLHFKNRPEFPGMSFANGDGEGMPYVVGGKPTWMPSLVPQTFQDKSQSQSRRPCDLGGNLSLVLGLMAFSDHWGVDHDILMRNTFHGQNPLWSGRVWRATGEPRGYPTIEETPQGFLVHVSLDDYENPGSTSEALAMLEREHPIVKNASENYSYY